LHDLNHDFQIISLTETWLKSNEKNYNYELSNYVSVHQPRQNHVVGGGLSIFVHKSINFVLRNDLNVNETDCESLCIEINNKATKNIIINSIYRKPSGNLKKFHTHLKTFLSKINITKKHVYLTGDYNLNLLNHTSNLNVQCFLDTLIQHDIIPTINKSTRITKTSSTLLDNIFTNNFHNCLLESGIIKTDITDHYPIFSITNNLTLYHSVSKSTKSIRQINENSLLYFRNLLSEKTNWNLILQSQDVNNAYESFLAEFCKYYDLAFPVIKKIINPNSLLNPWMTKGLHKSSKRKQKLYEKYLKHKTYKNEIKYKNYKNLFEKIKKHSKKNYYAKLLEKTHGNTQKTWNVIKQIIGKNKCPKHNLPQKLLVDGEIINNKEAIINKLNNFFLDIGPKLADKIPKTTSNNFASYINTPNTSMIEFNLNLSEVKNAFNCLKNNKCAGIDKISVNVVKAVYDIIEPSLFHIFNISLKSGIVPEKLKIAKIIPIFKNGDDTNMSNYRPISVLSCFSKLLERIMYDRLNNYLTENNILYNKQFGFKKNHSTDHAVVDLINYISNGFNNDCYTLGVFIDLSKAFDTVNHDILIKKLEMYGVLNNNLQWFKSYLSNRKQYIIYTANETENHIITCGVPQGSILGPLLFLLYINDLYLASKILNVILFADDSNLFYSNSNIKDLFRIFNEELSKVNEWIASNKLSLNVDKTKFMLFHKPSKGDNLSLKLPDLFMNKKVIKREATVNFLGVIIDENISWKFHIKSIENKISKNISMLYKIKPFLNMESLKIIYFSFIHSYLSYCNIAWGSTNYGKLKKIYSKQKHACRIIFGVNRTVNGESLLKKLNVLNVYKLNIYQVMLFTFKSKHALSPNIFHSYFTKISHKYPTKFSSDNFVIPRSYLKLSSFQIQYRGPFIWKSFLKNIVKDKILLNFSLEQFKRESKRFLLEKNFDFKYFF